ncbi:MAG: hypothetical protein ABI333_14850 [bacterium]
MRSYLISLIMVALLAACGPTQASGNDNGNTNTQGCNPGETECSGACVNTLIDPLNCGGCGVLCMPGELCDGSGNCSTSCPSPMVNCSGSCVDTGHDINNCGTCGHPCTASEICNLGTCEDDSCAESSAEAHEGVLPADIIMAVDNSGSMTDEAGFVQDAMTSFVSIVTGAGIDYHVILISADSTDEQGICMPAPLGNGSCPNDENLPLYRHVPQGVASSNAFDMILSTYPLWSANLRPNATRHIAVITDDNSAMSAADFQAQMIALDPSFQGFKFSAVYAPYEVDGLVCMGCTMAGTCGTPQCDTCCGADTAMGLMCTPLPAEEGTVYRALVNMTGGVSGDLCTQDFVPAFTNMATAVVSDSQVPCVYDIPDPGPGVNIDFGRVNVEYIPTPGSNPQLIYYVPGGLTDCGANGGWYYDNPPPGTPTQVLLCPDTCYLVEANLQAQINVKFGCASVVN